MPATAPLAVGLLSLPGALADRRRRARLAIAVRAHTEGYALLDTIDASAPLIGMDGALDAVRRLSEQHGLRAVLLLGVRGVDRARAANLAREHCLVTVAVSEN